MTRTCITHGCLTTFALAMLCAAARGGEGQYKAIYGKNLRSKYSVSKDDAGCQLLSADLFDPYGNARSEAGQIVAYSVVETDENGITPIGETPLTVNRDGEVWTPRTERIGKLDLRQAGKITDNAGFDLAEFAEHPATITFTNGFAVNLYGAKCEDDRIIDAGNEGTYLTRDGKILPGRVMRPHRTPDTRVHAGDTIVTVARAPLMDGRRVVGTVKPYAVLKASAVNGKWVRVLIRQDDTTIKGWIDVAHLAGRDARWEEVVLGAQ